MSLAPREISSLPSLVARAEALLAAQPGERVIIGIVGCPGSGKSALAEALARTIPGAAWVPMDGYHLADAELVRLGRRERKGAIDTFDAHGYLALLRRIRTETSTIVYAPEFDRRIEQPVAGAIPVLPETRVIITEGNYLLDDAEPWPEVREALDEVWFRDVADVVRQERLIARHVQFGKAPDFAREWVATVDEPNAQRIIAGAAHADVLVNDLDLHR
ncbi:hypothetical protein SAMN06298212_10746 [Ruaniaceae bacterium KH17]|nr:hypothetical protein SAMN06298212_10746 [Ruaniaceae bacterium KH17]